MPRNYKTGPARSRRRPDPATLIRPGEVICPVELTLGTPGPGILTVTAVPINPTTGIAWVDGGWGATGLPSDAYVVELGGAVFPLVINTVSDQGLIDFNGLTGLAAGFARVIFAARDQSVRHEYGGWFGTGYNSAVVS